MQPKGIGQANQAPETGSVPISANSNPSVGGFLFALANSKVCFVAHETVFRASKRLAPVGDKNYSEVVIF